MALPSKSYRDPLEQLIEREERTCKGCAHETKVFNRLTCDKKNQKYGRRCRHYTEKEGTANVQCKRETST
ncbi:MULTISPECIES: hypothetical protein [Herbaspirillum]|uniref:hypothetical protein n=1 Tax=Herbaspirillum TaxID=963 RepID=UPI0012AC7FF0|nr:MULTISPECIES: hypothetical protein [Herbaspirillum]MRT30875.1 hypothetical protein [Herbaspirillum sp. CAH-3]